MRRKGGYTYIVSNKNRSVLYIGVTSKIYTRSTAHRNGEGSIFTSRFNCIDLLYYEFFPTIVQTIKREKQLKVWKRAWKENLIKKGNPNMLDLYCELNASMDIG